MRFDAKAVLFDFDGVIAQTMDDNFAAWTHAFSQHGITIQKQDYFLLEGRKPMEVAQFFLKPAGIDDESTFRTTVKSKEEFYIANNTFSLYPGAVELLQHLKSQGTLLALVTGAGRERLQNTLSAEIRAHFDCIVTANDVIHGKPSPECYEQAAKHLGVTNYDCIVIENAPLGIQSAKSANMRCVAIASTLPPEHLQNADIIVSSILDLSSSLVSTN
jgi:beta-phosphoglucomutase